MTPEQERVWAEVLGSLEACRDRITNLGKRYEQKNMVAALQLETAHERELLLQLERLASGAPPPVGTSVWERVKKPEV